MEVGSGKPRVKGPSQRWWKGCMKFWDGERVRYSYYMYPLVNSHITMENHHCSWENSLFLWPFSSSQTVVVITRPVFFSAGFQHRKRLAAFYIQRPSVSWWKNGGRPSSMLYLGHGHTETATWHVGMFIMSGNIRVIWHYMRIKRSKQRRTFMAHYFNSQNNHL